MSYAENEETKILLLREVLSKVDEIKAEQAKIREKREEDQIEMRLQHGLIYSKIEETKIEIRDTRQELEKTNSKIAPYDQAVKIGRNTVVAIIMSLIAGWGIWVFTIPWKWPWTK